MTKTKANEVKQVLGIMNQIVKEFYKEYIIIEKIKIF